MALEVAGVGAGIQMVASLPLGPLPFLLGAVASGSAAAYNLWLSRTPYSVVPYLVSFSILPLWIAAGVGVDLARVAAAPLLVGPVRRGRASREHAARLRRGRAAGLTEPGPGPGRETAFRLAWALAFAVGLGVGAALLVGGPVAPVAIGLGIVGLAAVAQGRAGPQRLWAGMLVAAVCWTAAWALATA